MSASHSSKVQLSLIYSSQMFLQNLFICSSSSNFGTDAGTAATVGGGVGGLTTGADGGGAELRDIGRLGPEIFIPDGPAPSLILC